MTVLKFQRVGDKMFTPAKAARFAMPRGVGGLSRVPAVWGRTGLHLLSAEEGGKLAEMRCE
jgi:hypothetical protein